MPSGNVIVVPSFATQRRRCSLTDLPTYRRRHRNYSDHRYNTEQSNTSSYSDVLPRYRSSHGYSEFQRDPYTSYSSRIASRGSLQSDGDSMSKYTRGYDINTNRNTSEYTTKSYDSPRYSDRGKLNLDKFDSDVTSPPFEFGVSYKSPRTHDTSTKNHDISTKSYDRTTKIDDVTTRRSPARNTSISDRDVASRQAHVDPPLDRRRQRLGSNDSSSSHSSERSTGTEDRSLLNALKHRYQETAEKQYEDPGTRAPFSSWRRSGNFEEVTSSIAPEAGKEKTKSLERKTFHGDSDRTYLKPDSYRDERSRSSSKDTERSRSGAQESSAVSDKKTELSTDDLIYNFRQALCRHAISEQEKSLEHEKASDLSAPRTNIEDDATAQRLERLRAARAKIHEQRNSDKINSLTFATEYKVEKDKQEKSRSSSVSSDRDKGTSEDGSKTDELKHRQSTKLIRQKLVSDDLRAKYMIKREDDKDKASIEPNTEDSLSRKRSERKQRLKEHTEIWSKEPAVERKEDVPSMEDMLLGSTQQTKTSTVAKKFQNVDHSSPFGSVYSRPSSVVVTTTSPLTSLTSPAITTTTTTSLASSTDETVESQKSKNEISEVKPEESKPLETSRQKSKSDRKYKKYNQKSKSLELGLLSENAKEEQEIPIETKDDTSIAGQTAEDLTQLNRQERIAKYKEERRKQLKTIQDKFAAGEMPSLFISSKSETDSPVTRSHSLKVDTGNKYAPYGSSVSRSKSLKEESEKESDYSGRASPVREMPKVTPGLRLAEIGNQEKVSSAVHVEKGLADSTKKSEADKIIDKLHALKRLTKEQLQKSHEGGANEDVVDIGQSSSYTSRALLADRVMDDSSSREKTLTPARVRSSSRETDGGKSDKVEHSKHKFVREPEPKKSYFEFGTVFSKKEPKTEIRKSVERTSSTEASAKEDQVKESNDTSTRVRRILPSIEDVLGTNGAEDEKPSKETLEAKPTEVEVKPDIKVDLTKEDISKLRAGEIQHRKITGNIERAKNKFKEDDKNAGVFEASRFELGTVYTSKKEEKPKTIPAQEKVISYKEPTFFESTQQVKLNVDTEKSEKVQERRITNVVEMPVDVSESNFEPQIALAKVKPLPESKDVKSPGMVENETKSQPLFSPRSERRRRAEQKFGKVSYRSNEAFEFGTSYAKKDSSDDDAVTKKSEKPVYKPEFIQPIKEKTPELAPETMKEPKKVIERESKITQGNEPNVTFQPPAYAYPKPESNINVNITAQTVTRAGGQSAEVSSAPRRMSPVRSVVTATAVKGATIQDVSYSQPMKVEMQPKKPHKEMFAVEQHKEDKHLVRSIERVPSLETKINEPLPEKKEKPVPEKKPVRPLPERQTSFTKLELKSPVEEKVKDETLVQSVITQQKAETAAPTTLDRQISTGSVTKLDRQISTGSITIDPGEIKSAFDMHKKLVEGKIEEQSIKRRSANIEDWAVDKSDKKCELFEMHKKQIEMKLETKQESTHLEKTIEKQDSEVFELHKKQIRDKLELKYESVASKADEDKPEFVMDERLESKEEKVRMEIEKMRKIEAEKQRRLEVSSKLQHLEERSEQRERIKAAAPSIPERVKTKTEIPEKLKGRMEKALMETSLDDILSKNVDYLSDMESIQLKSGKDSRKKRPQSVHDHQKPKRSFKKKSGSKRSKSEERSQLKVADSEEDLGAGRSEVKVAEGYQRSSSSRVTDSRDDGEIRYGGTGGSSQDTYSGEDSEEEDTDKYSSEYDSSNARLVSQTDEECKLVSSALLKAGNQSGELTGTDISESDGKRTEFEYQSIIATGIQKTSPSISEMLAGETIRNQSYNLVSHKSESVSGMTSDTSDMSDRKRFITREGESSRLVSDSDQSISSAMSEGSRKRRKDKSLMRKSKLNESNDDASSVGRRRDSSDDSTQTPRVGVRRVSSSRLARESKYKGSELEVFDALKRHDLEISLTKRGTSPSSSSENQSNIKHAINSDHKHVNNIDSPRTVNKSVLDSHSVLPSRFALPSKVSAAISRLTESSERESSPQTKVEDQHAPRRIRRGNNFSQLLQKFSGSEASSSEKSDSESPRRNKTFLKRQEACNVSSGSSSDTRRTPERTQSLKIRNTESPDMEKNSLSSVQRSSSFKSDFMKRKFSPEPVERRRLPATPGEQSDKPSDELAKVLNKRSVIVAKQQEDGDVIERKRIHDGKVEKSDKYSAAGNDDVIADSEVLKMLRSRRKETDSSVSESEAKSQTQPSETVSALKIPSESQNLSQTHQPSIVDANNKGRVQSQISFENKISIESPKTTREETNISVTSHVKSREETKVPVASHVKPREETKVPVTSHIKSREETNVSVISHVKSREDTKVPVTSHVKPREDTKVSVASKVKSEGAKTLVEVPKLDLTSIDTSLSVLQSVTNDLDDTKTISNQSRDRLNTDLSHLKVTSPTQVAQFIKSVETESHKNVDLVKDLETAPEITPPLVAKSKVMEPKVMESKVESKAESVPRPRSPTSSHHGSIDITNKNEIMRKISTRDRTPERQTPKRSGPIKVISKMQSETGPTLKRTESVGRSESERPKGILKRTPSLKQTGVNVDPELAEVLKSRRQRHEEVDEEDENRKLTAEEEIQMAREEAQSKNVEEREVSVAERIFQMHTKIEEVKSCPITPKAYSGFTTPRSAIQRSGNITPRSQFSFDEGNKEPGLSGSQLIERLTSLEGRQSSISEKRQKFVTRRRDDARTRTQPVTLQEIQLADSLETVKKFRSKVIQKASTNVFEALQEEERKATLKNTEYPQPVRIERRSRNQRHKTLPVTAEELKAIPEGETAGTMNSLKKKFDTYGARDSKADSGILSGSDGDFVCQETESWRSLSIEENIGEDDPVKLSVSAKASMFLQIQESLKEKKKSASGAKRYIDRKKRERSRTLPITEDEVKLAAEIADKEEEEKKINEATPVVEETAEAEDNDELSRQSLKDKVKLFTTIEEEKKIAAQKKGLPPPPRRKNRKLASRFATQPVTFEEVEKAAKISPLACSLVKPPDPEILSGLSVKAQRELMTQHAQQTLSQPSSRAGSRVPSRATSISDLSGEVINQDSLTISNTDVNSSYSLVDTGASSESVRPSEIRSKGFEIKRTEEKHSSQTVEKVQVSNLDSKKKNILKSQLEAKLSLLHGAPKGILRPNSDVVPTISDINKVLKKESSMESENKTTEVKGILKREGSFETSKLEEETKSAIKGSDLNSDSVAETESDDYLLEGGIDSSGDNLDSDEGLLDDKTSEFVDTPVRRRDNKARRRFNRERNLEQERYKTQPAEVGVDSPDSSKAKKKYVGRHLTQPVTPDEKKEAEIATDSPEITKSGSINDRLHALKKSGDEDWRKRVSRPLDLEKLDRRSASPEFTPPTSNVKMREKKGLDMPRPNSIANRMSLLGNAQEGWRDRVGETDVKKFTIEHKMSSSGQTVGESPLVARLRGKTPRKENSRDSESSENSDLISPTSPTKPLPKEVVCPDLPAEILVEESKSTLATIDSIEEEKGGTTVSVPQMGAELEHFFQTREEVEIKSQELEVSVDDFNELFLNANDMLETQRRVKPKRRYNTKSRNPLKTMSASLEVRSEYTEVIHGVAERELKNVKVAALQQNSGFAVEALAGLASKENFAKVELRKTDSNGAGTPGTNTRMEPYLPLMLIHIKGRRKVQCRLVEPKADSVNSGDCYVLITPDKIIQWIGDYCNVIEKAKAADVCDFVKQKRDLGCKHAREVMIIEEKKGHLGNARYFWDLLGGYKPYMACGPTEEDELYESHVVETNMIYTLDNNKLVPVKEYWGNQPKYEMLQSSQVYVFDFGSELYLWQGKGVAPNQRKVSLKLAQQLWNQGYDYSQCDINPLSPLRNEDEGGYPNVCEQRPDWSLFGKVNENMETILFREKFADWPDTSRIIKVKSQEEVNAAKVDLADLKAYDAKLMVPIDTKAVSLVLEGSHVGRGTKWEQDMEGFMKEQEIQTLKVRIWHVLEYEHYEIEDHSYGQFHEGDTYVVRWQYMIVNAGMKSLKGQASKFSQLGRERCAYFFWQGKSSTINEKGASALMTVELDEERGPQVRVSEGKEPPCFLNLFKGHMIIHVGKREEEETNTQGPWRFYCLRNEFENEMCLIEVPKDISNLRSVSSFLLLNVVTGNLMVWHGCKSPQHTRILARKAADNLRVKCPLEVGLHDGVDINVTEVQEGKERVDFWRTMNVHRDDRSKYHCLLDNPESFSHTLRLFHMTSVSGVFEAQEILNPSRTQELPTKFPVLQTELYMAQQPTLFLIDNGHEVYLWQGWWPEGDEDQENVLTGSAQTRFTVDRRCAMETTLAYCKEINADSPPPAYMVYAGLEPLSFTNLFPFWTVDETARELNLRDGKTEGELVPVQDLLKKLTKTRYTFAELLETPLPEGVDPLKLESYLSDAEFEGVLELTRDEFYALPAWKQQKMKQQAGLF